MLDDESGQFEPSLLAGTGLFSRYVGRLSQVTRDAVVVTPLDLCLAAITG